MNPRTTIAAAFKPAYETGMGFLVTSFLMVWAVFSIIFMEVVCRIPIPTPVRTMRFVARTKFRFDLGQSFLTILSFCMVCVAAAPTIATALDVSARAVVIVIVPTAIISVVIFGTVLDKARFWHHYQDEQNQRNELLQELRRDKDK